MPRPTDGQILNAPSRATMYNHATYPVGQAAEMDLAEASPLGSLFTETAVTPEVQAQDRAGWEYAEEEQAEQFNREQRIRRAAYVEGVMASNLLPEASSTGLWLRDVRASAARRYPLKKRVPRVIPDPHKHGEWRYTEEHAARFQWRLCKPYRWGPHAGDIGISPERARELSALLDDPWTWEDSTDVEGEAT